MQQKRRLVQRTGGDISAAAAPAAEEEGELFEETFELEDGAALSGDEGEGGEAGGGVHESYVSKYRGVEMRVKILENELVDTKEEEIDLTRELDAANKVLEHLLQEKQHCLREEERIRRTRELIQSQLAEQEQKLRQVTQKQEGCSRRSALIVETLKPLTLELDKLRLLVEGTDAI